MALDKADVRRRIWALLEEKGVARFPLPAFGRIPNFVGAEEAARRLASTEDWRRAEVVKVNPDSPQRPVRELALAHGRLLIVPTPRLREGFLLLDPRKVPKEEYAFASTIKGSFKWGSPISPEDMPKVNLVVIGSVAVNRYGDRLGKSEGYSEIEWAIVKEEGKVDEGTPVVTTVHDLQIVKEDFPTLPYDLPVDLIVTPTKILRAERRREKPRGIYWDLMPSEKVREIPLLSSRFRAFA